MKYKGLIMKGIIALIMCAGIVGGCSYLNKKVGLEDDNVIEELLEQQIKNQIGLDFDLSPGTPEDG